MILFWMGLPTFFLVLPLLFVWFFSPLLGISDFRVKLVFYCLSVWLLWDRFQLPSEAKDFAAPPAAPAYQAMPTAAGR